MRGVGTPIGIIALICILSLISVPLAAEGLAGNGIVSSPGALGQPSGRTSDFLFGTDSTGPYMLSWKPINLFSETVSIDGEDQVRGLDYEVDYGSGTITFTESIDSKRVIRIHYGCDFSKAVQNKSAMSVPVKLDLLNRENAGLQFTALYKRDASDGNAPADSAVYGLSGNTKTKIGDFSAMLLAAPNMSEDGSAESGSFDDQSAMKLAGSTQTGALKLNSSYTHVGEFFSSAKEYQLQQGMDVFDLSAVYSPGEAFNFESSYKRSENLMGEKKGETDLSMAHKLSLSPDDDTKLTYSLTEVEKEKADGQGKSVITNILQLERQLGDRMSAAASYETVTTDVNGTETSLTTNQVSLEARPSENLSVSTGFIQKDSSADGESNSLDFNLDASPTKTVSVKAGIIRADSELAGREDSESLSLTAKPSDRLNMELSLGHEDTDADGSELSHLLKVIGTPRDDVKMEFTMAGVNAAEDESSQVVKLSTTALKHTTLGLDWSQKDSDIRGIEEVAGVRFETSPFKAFKLSGGLAQKETIAATELKKEARLEVTPFNSTKIGGAYSEVERDGTAVARAAELTADSKFFDFLAISGGYKDRYALAGDVVDSMNLAMTLNAGGLLALTGSYIENPENEKGIIQSLNSQSIGLQTNFGRLKVNGSYTLKDEYLAGKRREQTEVGLNYRLSSRSLLSTTYTIEELVESALLQTSIYALTYSHKVGSRMSLYLSGKASLYERDQQELWDQAEYEAEARLGLKF